VEQSSRDGGLVGEVAGAWLSDVFDGGDAGIMLLETNDGENSSVIELREEGCYCWEGQSEGWVPDSCGCASAALLGVEIEGLGTAASNTLSRVDANTEEHIIWCLNSETTASSSAETLSSLSKGLSVECLAVLDETSGDLLVGERSQSGSGVLEEGTQAVHETDTGVSSGKGEGSHEGSACGGGEGLSGVVSENLGVTVGLSATEQEGGIDGVCIGSSVINATTLDTVP